MMTRSFGRLAEQKGDPPKSRLAKRRVSGLHLETAPEFAHRSGLREGHCVKLPCQIVNPPFSPMAGHPGIDDV
jgi:hypothetical protein